MIEICWGDDYFRFAPAVARPASMKAFMFCKKMFSLSRKTKQRNPSHFGSYIQCLPRESFSRPESSSGQSAEPEICLLSFWRSSHEAEFTFFWCDEDLRTPSMIPLSSQRHDFQSTEFPIPSSPPVDRQPCKAVASHVSLRLATARVRTSTSIVKN